MATKKRRGEAFRKNVDGSISKIEGEEKLLKAPIRRPAFKTTNSSVISKGFSRVKVSFTDDTEKECSIQESSKLDPCIWIGIEGHRMRLTQNMVKELLPCLESFISTGSLKIIKINKENQEEPNVEEELEP